MLVDAPTFAAACSGDLDPGSCQRLDWLAQHAVSAGSMAVAAFNEGHAVLYVLIGAVAALVPALGLLLVLTGRRR